MVLEILNNLLTLPGNFLSEIVGLPVIGGFVKIQYGGAVFFGLLGITLLLSKFIKIKHFLTFLMATSISGFLLGDIYTGMLVFLIAIPFFVFVKLKKKDEFKDDKKSKDMDFDSDKGKDNELGLGDSGLDGSGLSGGDGLDSGGESLTKEGFGSETSESSFQEQKPNIGGEPQTQETRTCPYCNSQILYVPQYQRYYCQRCQMYF